MHISRFSLYTALSLLKATSTSRPTTTRDESHAVKGLTAVYARAAWMPSPPTPLHVYLPACLLQPPRAGAADDPTAQTHQAIAHPPTVSSADVRIVGPRLIEAALRDFVHAVGPVVRGELQIVASVTLAWPNSGWCLPSGQRVHPLTAPVDASE